MLPLPQVKVITVCPDVSSSPTWTDHSAGAMNDMRFDSTTERQ